MLSSGYRSRHCNFVCAALVIAVSQAALAAEATLSAANSSPLGVYRGLDEVLARQGAAAMLARAAQASPNAPEALIAAGLNELSLGHAEQASQLLNEGVTLLEKLTGARAQPAAFAEPAWDYAIQSALYTQDGATLIVITDRDTRLYRAKDGSLQRVIPRQGQEPPRVLEQDGQLRVHDGDVVSTWLLPNGWFLGVSKAPSKADSSGADTLKAPSQKCVGRYGDARLPTVCVTEAPHLRLIHEERQNCDGRAVESTTWFQTEGGTRVSLGEATTATCGSADWFLAARAGLELRRASTGAVLAKLSEGDGYFEQLLCNPPGHRVAALEGAQLRVWSAPQGELVTSLPAEQVPVSSLLVPKEGN